MLSMHALYTYTQLAKMSYEQKIIVKAEVSFYFFHVQAYTALL